MKVQIIENQGRPEWAVIPYADYEHLLEQVEALEELCAFDQAKRELAAAEDELIPAALVERLSNGEHPLRAWREYRGLTQQALADAVGVCQSDISELEGGERTGATATLRALAGALQVDIDDLDPWSASSDGD